MLVVLLCCFSSLFVIMLLDFKVRPTMEFSFNCVNYFGFIKKDEINRFKCCGSGFSMVVGESVVCALVFDDVRDT